MALQILFTRLDSDQQTFTTGHNTGTQGGESGQWIGQNFVSVFPTELESVRPLANNFPLGIVYWDLQGYGRLVCRADLGNMSSLAGQMQAALASRGGRLIRRSLPDPAESQLVDFNSNDYLSLSQYPPLRSHFISKLQSAPNVLGSGGSRLLVNGRAHNELETRLAQFFDAPAALLFNSGLDANIGFFSCVPHVGDIVVSDEYIHASVHDGVRASRVRGSHQTFSHNSMPALREVLEEIISGDHGVMAGRHNVFVAVESLYSMDGTFSPLMEIVNLVEELFPKGNGYVVVDEAHSTGIYGPQGRGIVALLGLENRVLARLHTFGKALAGSGGQYAALKI
jgi:8-amino-7-oxononanoate synthase